MSRGAVLRSVRSRAAGLTALLVVGILLPALPAVPVPAAGAAVSTGAADLDQCANGSAGTVTCASSAWQNGNLNQNKAHWYEGDSVPYRLTMSSVPTGTSSTVVVQWDTTQQGKHALDYVTSVDRTATTANPCTDVPSCDPSSFSSGAIPADPNITADATFKGHQVPGAFKLYGGRITAVSGYTLSGTYAGNSSTSITITFTASTSTPVLAWGGHISTQFDWGRGRSAISINGSPYHTRLISLNGKGGNQDRSLQTAAISPVGAIVVAKHALGGDGTFGFTGTGLPASALPGGVLSLTTTGGTAQSDLLVVPPTSTGYALSESTPPPGWDANGVTCDDPVPGNTSTTNGSSATVRVDAGEVITCTFTNTRRGSVTVVKQAAGGDGRFDFSLSGAGTKTVTTSGGTGSQTWTDVVPGAYTLTEALPSHWMFGSASCAVGSRSVMTASVPAGAGLTVPPGANVVCTFGNTRLGSVSVVERAVGGDATFPFSLSGAAPVALTTTGGSAAYAFGDVPPGGVSLTQVTPAGWDLTSASCTASGQSLLTTVTAGGVSFALAAGVDATCTFVDTRRASVTVEEHARGGDASFDFSLSGQPTRTVATSGGVGSSSWSELAPGAATLVETRPAGWDPSGVTCATPVGPVATVSVPNGVGLVLDPGASVTCSFSDTARGSVTVVKQADGGDATFAFSLTGQPDRAVTTVNGHGSATWSDLIPGDLTVSEAVPTGWDLGSISCVAGNAALPTIPSPSGVAFTLLPGAAVTCTFADTARGSVNVVEHAVGGDAAFPFSLTGQPDRPVVTSGGTGTAAWNLLVPGSYTLTQADPPGWDFGTASCVAGNDPVATSVDGTSVTFGLPAGADVTCTVTNIARGSITVAQHTDPAGSAASFPYTFDGNPLGLTGDGASQTFDLLQNGTHGITTGFVPGWMVSGVDCGSAPVTLNGGEVDVALAPGAHVTCVVSQTKLATVTVVERTLGHDGAFTFSLTGQPSRNVITVGRAGATSWSGLAPGQYAVGQNPAPGWDLTGLSCDQPAVVSGPVATLALPAGANVTCTFTDAAHGTLLVREHATGGDGSFAFALNSLDAQTVATTGGTGSTSWSDVAPGATKLAAIAPSGWRHDATTCAAGGANLPVTTDGSSVSFTLAPGADVVCDSFDTKLASVTVVKQAIGGDDSFDFTLSGVGTQTVVTQGGTGTTTWTGVAPGTRSLTEAVPAGWDLGTVACVADGSPLTTTALAGGVSFGLAPGSAVTCTFTDAARGSITLVEHTTPSTTTPFAFTVDGAPVTLPGDGASTVFGSLTPGTHHVQQTVPDQWQLDNVDCGDAPITLTGSAIDVDLPAGAHLVCTFNDSRLVPSISLDESVQGPGAPGDFVPYVFTVTNTGQTALTNVVLDDDVLGPIPLDVDTLQPGASTVVSAGTFVPVDAQPGTQIVDHATATGTPPFGDDVVATSTGTLDVVAGGGGGGGGLS